MERNNLIPSIDTNDLDPKTPWELQREEEIRQAAEKLHEEEEAKKPVVKERSLFVKIIIAIVIIGAIIGLGILLPIKIIPNASSMIANIFNSSSTKEENVAATTTAFTPDKMSIKTEDMVKLSWPGPIREDGQYKMQFPCTEGVAVVMIAADGTKYQVPCDEPLAFVSTDNTLTIAVQSRYMRVVDVPFTFMYIASDGAQTDYGQTPITVINNFPEITSATSTSSTGGMNTTSTTTGSGWQEGTSTSTTSTGNTSSGNTSTVTTKSKPTVYGSSDLKVRIMATGILDKNTGAFIPTSAINSGDRPAVQFEIVNVGTNYSGTWSWSAIIPTADTKTYMSAPQASLAPNGRVIFTLGFDNPKSGNAVMLINADPANTVVESNESNNIGTIAITGNGTASTNGVDLKVSLVSVGYMNGNKFVADSTIDTGDKAAIQFKVTNTGDKASGSWKFDVEMTRDADDGIYESGSQNSLAPGQTTTVTVGFDNPSEGRQSFKVSIDSSSDVNSGNDDLSASIKIEN